MRVYRLLPALLLLAAASVQAEPLLSCFYTGRNSGDSFDEHRDCAGRADGKLFIRKRELARMAYDRAGLAAVYVGDQYYYARRSGALLAVLAYDNGADPYSEGLVRALVGGRIAYYDLRFRQVIAPKYDWGWPFEQGRALVCLGCRREPPDSDGHAAVSGGLWGYIDRRGREVVPVKLSRQDALRLNGGP